MKTFLSEDFLLQTETAKRLYHDYAANLPIIDYHCHLPPSDIAENRKFNNLTRIWLEDDHYKWRAMRALGIDEKFITGDSADKQKFDKWAYTVPYTMRNPLYHWSHMELKNYFGIEKLLNPDSADEVYKRCNEQLEQPDFSTRNLLRSMNVELVCTTDDPVDSLEHHKKIKSDGFEIKTRPAFRPDNVYNFTNPDVYNRYVDKLQQCTEHAIKTFDDLLETLEKRVDYFHSHGCRLSDHGLEKLHYQPASHKELNRAFSAIRNGDSLSRKQQQQLTCHILLELGRMYHQRGWVQQFHLGALRNTNERMRKKLGPDSGFDSIGDSQPSRPLAQFLNALDVTEQLPKTILYNLNPADSEMMATMTGNFNTGTVKGKMQYGAAWWYLDQKDGIESQLNILSNMGLLSCFVGMLTDSRSFLSYPRHEYFRRILCNLIGNDVENGELPTDLDWLGKIVSDVCYYNADEYFNFQEV